MDNTETRDGLSYYYWTEPSSPGWHQWVFYDFMMRVYTTSEVGIQTNSDHDNLTLFTVSAPTPSPFCRDVSITFSIPREGGVVLNVYDITGRRVAELAGGIKAPGEYTIHWCGTDMQGRKLSSGIYFVKIDYEHMTATKKMVFLAD